jgi:hypothetical protein
MRKWMMAALTLMPGMLAACGAASTAGDPGGAAAGGSNITAQEIVAVAEQTFPQAGQYYIVCGVDGNVTSCPYTDRLKARLAESRQTLGRAENPSGTRTVRPKVTGPDSGVAHVLTFQGRQALDLMVVKRAGRVLVDDETCTGQPSTTIYGTFTTC